MYLHYNKACHEHQYVDDNSYIHVQASLKLYSEMETCDDLFNENEYTCCCIQRHKVHVRN